MGAILSRHMTIPATNPTTAQATRVGDALYLILISPSYALQR